jgi:hypothetical protein
MILLNNIIMKKLFLLFLFVPGLAFADRLDDLKDELDQVKAELEQLDEVQPEPVYVEPPAQPWAGIVVTDAEIEANRRYEAAKARGETN